MIELNELKDAAQKAFPADQLSPDRDESWKLIAEMGWLMLPVPEELGGLGLGLSTQWGLAWALGPLLLLAWPLARLRPNLPRGDHGDTQ